MVPDCVEFGYPERVRTVRLIAAGSLAVEHEPARPADPARSLESPVGDACSSNHSQLAFVVASRPPFKKIAPSCHRKLNRGV